MAPSPNKASRDKTVDQPTSPVQKGIIKSSNKKHLKPRKARPVKPALSSFRDRDGVVLFPSVTDGARTQHVRERCKCHYSQKQRESGAIELITSPNGEIEPTHRHLRVSRSKRLTTIENGVPYPHRLVSSVTEPIPMHNPRRWNKKDKCIDETPMAVVMYGLVHRKESKQDVGVGPVVQGTQGWITENDMRKVAGSEGIDSFRRETFPAVAGIVERYAYDVIRLSLMTGCQRGCTNKNKTLQVHSFDVQNACRLLGRPLAMGVDFPSGSSKKKRKVGKGGGGPLSKRVRTDDGERVGDDEEEEQSDGDGDEEYVESSEAADDSDSSSDSDSEEEKLAATVADESESDSDAKAAGGEAPKKDNGELPW